MDTSQIKNWYLSLFKDFENHLNGEKSGPFHEVRREAIDRFAELDFPDMRQEDWRFTDISPILKHTFSYVDRRSAIIPKRNEISRFLFNGLKSHLLVFVNGFYSDELSTFLPLPDGVIVGGLSNSLKRDHDKIINHIHKLGPSSENVFAALNTAFAVDGAFIEIPDNAVIGDSIHLLFLSTGTEKLISQPRNLIIAGKNSQVRIIEQYESLSSAVYFTNAVTDVFASEGSNIDVTKIQSESLDAYHVATTQVSLDSNSNYESHAVSLGANIYRHDLNVALTGEGSNTTLEGLYLLSGDQLSDTHSFIDHAAPHCTSQEHYKGILDGRSRGVFNGKIMVRKGAQKTNSYQENRNIILSNEAKVDTKPQLEIFADDVKCSHGATVGQLSKESMFYLRSRGLDEDQAISILIYAFANDVLTGIKEGEVRKDLEDTLSRRFLDVAI